MSIISNLYYRFAVYGALIIFFTASGLFNLFCAFVLFFGLHSRLEKRCLESLRTLFKLWIWLNKFLGLISFDFKSVDQLQQLRGHICIANHPTILDAPMLASIIPNSICVYKEALGSSPFYGAIVRACGFLPNLGGPDMVRVASEKLASGSNIIIFPDGTRSHTPNTSQWKGGFALIAKRVKCPISLIWIQSPKGFLDKGTPLFQTYKTTPALMTVKLIEEINVGPRESIDNAMRKIADTYDLHQERLS